MWFPLLRKVQLVEEREATLAVVHTMISSSLWATQY